MLNLQNLNLAQNNLNGPIPASWGRLSNLKHLVVRGNHLTGPIPESLINITGLMELDLSSNDFTGNVPQQLFSTRAPSSEDEPRIWLGQIKRFSYREIQLATDNFNKSKIIGQGGYGKVYKGVLTDNMKLVAVKRLMDCGSPDGEIHLISIAVHKNLLRLIGYCTTSTERILVYPFMQNKCCTSPQRSLCPRAGPVNY
ncbi:plasma membrane receptor-like kinase, partial [Striga asiatica]